jgi:hypothetical protein
MVPKTCSRSTVRPSSLPPVSEWLYEQTEIASVWTIKHKGNAVDLIITDAYSSFDLSSMKEGGNRKTLALRLPRINDEPSECMEARVIHEIGERNDMLFCSDVDQEHLLTKYKALTKTNGDYPRQLKVKVTTTGSHATRYLDKDTTRIVAPVDHTGLVCTVRIVIRSVWVGIDA